MPRDRGGLASTRASVPARETQVWAEKQVRKIKQENGRGWVALVCGGDPSARQSPCGSGGGGSWKGRCRPPLPAAPSCQLPGIEASEAREVGPHWGPGEPCVCGSHPQRTAPRRIPRSHPHIHLHSHSFLQQTFLLNTLLGESRLVTRKPEVK